VKIWLESLDAEMEPLEQERRLDKLSQSSAAWYSSAESANLRRNGCTPKTRIGLLTDMKGWAYDNHNEKIYWLNGMAGTEKTTIAYTLSDELHKDRKLAASFFCSRQLPSCRDENLILPTIAYQLARFSRPFRSALSAVLETHPDVHSRQLSEQFEGLIAGPLQVVKETMPGDLVIVIDALDECDMQDGVDRVLDMLISHALSLPIKFFVSSRPEPKILNRMQSQKNKDVPFQLRLHDLDQSIVRADITMYLTTELDYMNLSAAQLDILITQAGVLFIYAATMARYIQAGDHSRSPERLEEVLEAPSALSAEDSTIDALYTMILGAAFDNATLRKRDKEHMMLVLHTVICAQEPLAVAEMAKLLNMSGERLVRAALSPLLSVLSIAETTGTVTTLHESFPDYVLDQNRSERFHCNTQRHNGRLAQACFDLISIPNPPFNICGLESSYILDKDVIGLAERVDRLIPKELFYACQYWGSHLRLAGSSLDLFSSLHGFLSVRLLLWFEVMSLKQRIHIAVLILAQVQSWSEVSIVHVNVWLVF
jgi:hypothetical protein